MIYRVSKASTLEDVHPAAGAGARHFSRPEGTR